MKYRNIPSDCLIVAVFYFLPLVFAFTQLQSPTTQQSNIFPHAHPTKKEIPFKKVPVPSIIRRPQVPHGHLATRQIFSRFSFVTPGTHRFVSLIGTLIGVLKSRSTVPGFRFHFRWCNEFLNSLFSLGCGRSRSSTFRTAVWGLPCPTSYTTPSFECGGRREGLRSGRRSVARFDTNHEASGSIRPNVDAQAVVRQGILRFLFGGKHEINGIGESRLMVENVPKTFKQSQHIRPHGRFKTKRGHPQRI